MLESFTKWYKRLDNQPSLLDKMSKEEIIHLYTKNIESFLEIYTNNHK